mgnify:CR=1 FL=1
MRTESRRELGGVLPGAEQVPELAADDLAKLQFRLQP